MTSGLTAQGFSAPTADEEVLDLNSKFLANIDAGLDLAPDQPIGQIIGIFAQKLAEAYQLGATVFNAINPNAAEGVLLDNVAAISGTHRQQSTFSLVELVLTLNASTTVPAGSIVSVAGQPGNTWVLAQTTTSVGAGTYNAGARSTLPGPFQANANTITVINTPIVGWTGVNNPLASVLGFSADTDMQLRQKREAELAGQGSGDIDAIRAAILKVPEVLQAFVFENTSLTTDSTGLPGKAFRVVVWDGATPLASNQAIGQAIWNQKPSGIQSFGAISVTVNDSAGNPHVVYFDRAQQLRVWVTMTTTPATTDSATVAAIKEAVRYFGQLNFNLGSSIIARAFSASPLEPIAATASEPAYTPTITDVPTFAFDTHSTPTNTGNLTATGLQIFTVATADMLCNGI
jgi:uncharacterized phage protein gp47/JayE